MRYYQLLTIGIVFFSVLFYSHIAQANLPSKIELKKQLGFFRFSLEKVKMPSDVDNMGLLGINYFADITPSIYGGLGGYGSITGTQGGLFVLGMEGGIHKEWMQHWRTELGLFAGGGGGHSSMVGGGLMLRPHIGVAYDWQWIRLGAYYSYISFPTGTIHSQQFGLNLDIPCKIYYISPQDIQNNFFSYSDLQLPFGKYLFFQRNDFGLLVQAYNQPSGAKNVNGEIQDGTIGLVGAELDHYLTEKLFWWFKSSGAFRGIPNGYMDVLGGFGYRWNLGSSVFTVVPQIGLGAGGGANVDVGGGFLVQPEVGIEWPLSSSFAARVSGGYLMAPQGTFRATTLTAEIMYHLDIPTERSVQTNLQGNYNIQAWRIQVFNQTYIHPQRSLSNLTSSANLIGVQIDQLFTPIFFLSYQAASAYSGNHMGGYASGMIGPGLQTFPFLNNRARLFAELLVGAGGGGGLALGGGALIEPVIGMHYALTPAMGVQASVGQLKAYDNQLNTPIVNLGVTLSFGMLHRQ